MKALIFEAGRIAVHDVPEPKPAKGEALIKIRLAGICSTDIEVVRGYAGFEGILGHEFVGDVVAGSSDWQGKRVVGDINCVCGKCDMCQSGLSNHCRRRTVLGIAGRPGVFAEYTTLPERNLHEVPASIPDENAVFVEPLAAALQVPLQLKLEPQASVAVLGTGRLGLLVAQVLALRGCRLLAIGRNEKTLALLDRKRIQTARVDEIKPGRDHDYVVDCTGSPDGLRLAFQLVRPRGTIVMKTTCASRAERDLTPLVVDEITMLGSRCGPFSEAISVLAKKQVDVSSLITRQMPLEQGVEAMTLAQQPDQIKILLKGAT